ncbi:MAG: hypothetical protein ABIU05_20240 [Nitrospirales bacterium]
MSTVRQTLEKGNPFRIPIDQFSYDPDTRKFRYRPTGQVWKAGGIDALVEPVVHQGTLVKPSLWMKLQAALKEIR